MKHAPAAAAILILMSVGCADHGDRIGKGGPTGTDGDAALGERGPRRTDSLTNSSPAPSVEPDRADRENAPVP